MRDLQNILEDFAENYAAASTFDRRDALAEDLYCIAKQSPDCTLNYAQIFEYMQGEALTPLTLASTVLDIANFLRTGDFGDDDRLFKAMFALQLSYVLAGSLFNGMTLPAIGSIMQDALPSSRWEEWEDCETPPPDPACVDFKIDRYTWDEQADGTWNIAVGFRGAYSAFYNSTVLRVWRDVSGGVADKIIYKFSTPVTDVLLYQPSGGFALLYTGVASDEIEFSAATFPGSWSDVSLSLGLALDLQTTGDTSASIAFVEACVYSVE